MSKCICASFPINSLDDFGEHHHIDCEKYATEKFTYLFYWADGIDAWVPVPGRVEGGLIFTSDELHDGETMTVNFKRFDMTDLEYDTMDEK